MKKIYILLLSFSLISLNSIFAQDVTDSMQASIGPGPVVAGGVQVQIYLKAIRPTQVTESETISSLDFNLAVRTSDFTTPPTVTVASNVFGITWGVEAPISEGGYWNFHILKSLDITYSFTTGLETPVMVVKLTGGAPVPIVTPLNVSLVTLPDGGLPEGANGAAVFYCTGTIYSNGRNLYYPRTEGVYSTRTTNAFSYRPVTINSTLGDAPSSATITLGTTPVKFTGFNAIRKNDNALLTWQIENESPIANRYEIERSLNGVNFKKVYTIPAKNNGSSSNTYELTDLNLSSLRSSGIFYYRIKQVDKDERFVYTETRSVRFTSKELIIGVFPNPIKNFANVSIDIEKNADAIITINDAGGKQYQNVQIKLFKGLNTKKIDMAGFASGSYMLKIQTDTESKTIPIIKTN